MNSNELLPDSWLVTFFPTPPPREIYDPGGTGIFNMLLLARPYRVKMCDTSKSEKVISSDLRTHSSPRYKFHFKGRLLTTVEQKMLEKNKVT